MAVYVSVHDLVVVCAGHWLVATLFDVPSLALAVQDAIAAAWVPEVLPPAVGAQAP